MFVKHSPLRRLVPLAGALILAATLAACDNGDKAAQAQPPRTVLAQKVAFEPRMGSRSFAGVIRPRIESDLGFRVGGKLAERLVQAGDRVKAGQPLARLDPADLRLQEEQAGAELKAAEAALTAAQADDRRLTALFAKGWTTPAATDRQRAVVEEARGRLLRAERAATLAANSLGYATLTADADGVITSALVEPGQVLAAGQPALRLARLDGREAVVAIPEAFIDHVKKAQAQVTLWSGSGVTFPAILRELSPSADAATRTYQAKFTLQGDATALDFGQTATVTLKEPDSARIARLPLAALFNQGTGASVYVVDPASGKLSLVPVDIAGYEARDVLLSGGVKEGDMVVTMGVQKLDAAEKVRIVTALN